MKQTERINEINTIYVPETQTYTSFNNTEENLNRGDRVVINKEGRKDELPTNDNKEYEEKTFKQKLVLWLKENDLKLS